VLALRERELEQVEQWVANEEQARQAIVAQIATHDAAVAKAMAEYNRLHEQAQGVPLEIAQGTSDVLRRLREARKQLEASLETQTQRCNQAKAMLKGAHIRKKSLEHLKEKAQRQFTQAQLKAEELMLEEITQNKFIREHAPKPRHTTATLVPQQPQEVMAWQ
jgi:flagellar export protein FliJ